MQTSPGSLLKTGENRSSGAPGQEQKGERSSWTGDARSKGENFPGVQEKERRNPGDPRRPGVNKCSWHLLVPPGSPEPGAKNS